MSRDNGDERRRIVEELVSLTRELGQSEHDLAILGEGNTSAAVDDRRFLVKASGSSLRRCREEDFVLMDRAATLNIFEDYTSNADFLAAMLGACVDANPPLPSVESLLHAYVLSLPGVKFAAHTHPVSVNTLLCSRNADDLSRIVLFPHHAVYCGAQPVMVPYAEPGPALARNTRAAVEAWMGRHQMIPRSIFLRKHGLLTLGRSADEALAATLMWSKAARIIVGAQACGGALSLTDDEISLVLAGLEPPGK